MRWFVLLVGMLAATTLAGCGTSPQSLGITGPGMRVVPGGPDDATLQAPGVPGAAATSSSRQRFFGYN